MGVLNVTPDSFSDGGLYDKPDSAIRHALQMLEDGADVIDIGGESTRPATFHDGRPLEIDEELRRVLPVVQELAKLVPGVQISIDTYKAKVAAAALEAGATIINDISGLTFDLEMARTAARFGCRMVIMHMVGAPRDVVSPDYVNLIEEIKSFFISQIDYAEAEGVDRSRIILDPGIGFGKNIDHNLAILNKLSSFKELGQPLLVGASRKTFIGKILGDAPPDERLEGTLATVAISIINGADIVRVHDVREAVRVAKVADAILNVA
jgi:dihydropteroate synthase